MTRPSAGAQRPAPKKKLDLRNPWVIDTRDLPRSPGSMREMSVAVPAPEGFGSTMLVVPKGRDIELELRLESVSEGVWVSGTAYTHVAGECGRCLEPFTGDSRARFNELYAYPGSAELLVDEDDLDAPDVSLIQDELIDLEPVVRDAILLGFPLNPLCKAECLGLCSICGIRLDDLGSAASEHSHETIDPRWAALGNLAGLTDLEDPSTEA